MLVPIREKHVLQAHVNVEPPLVVPVKHLDPIAMPQTISVNVLTLYRHAQIQEKHALLGYVNVERPQVVLARQLDPIVMLLATYVNARQL